MTDVTLQDGRKVEIDLYKVTRKEYARLGALATPFDEENAIVAKASGLTVQEVENLPEPDYDQLVKTIYLKRRELYENPT